MLKTLKNIFKKIQKQSIIVQTFLYLIIYLALRSIFQVINWSAWKIQTLEGFGNPPTQMTLFHWNKCGHCKKMMPEWNKFQSSYKGKLKIKKIEQGDNPSLIKKLIPERYSLHEYIYAKSNTLPNKFFQISCSSSGIEL